jgi:hypothetical protein
MRVHSYFTILESLKSVVPFARVAARFGGDLANIGFSANFTLSAKLRGLKLWLTL